MKNIRKGKRYIATCPCCSNKLLRHVRHGYIYWFCHNCWVEMPATLIHSVRLNPVSEAANLSVSKVDL